MAGRGSGREVERRALLRNKRVPGHELQALPAALDTVAFAGSFVQRAREHLRAAAGFQGLPAEFEADPAVQTTSGGAVAVHFRQQFKSIAIFLGAQTVRFTPDGRVEDAVGVTFTFAEDAKVEPRVTPTEAVLTAAQHTTELQQGLLGEPDDFGNMLDPPRVEVTGFQPMVIAAFSEMPDKPTVLAPGPFAAPIKTNLIFFPEGANLRLGWDVILTMPQAAGQYRVIVDANTREVLYSRQLADLLVGQGNVYVLNGGARQITPFPRPWMDYAVVFDPQALPAGVPPVPGHWLDDTRRDTFGNCVHARLGESGPPLKSALGQAGAVIFDPEDGRLGLRRGPPQRLGP